MKYIKTPVNVARHDIGSVYEADGSELCCCYGMVEDQRNKSAEIAMALNEHDALVAQCDALAGALTLVGVYLGLWPPEAKTMQARHCAELSEKITEALALVRVDDER